MSAAVDAYVRDFSEHAYASKDVGTLLRPFVPDLTQDQEARVRALLRLAYLKGHATDFVFTRAILLPKSGTKTQAVHTYRSVEDAEWYGQMVTAIEDQWVAGNFPPNPKSNLCGPKFCAFYAKCMPHKTTHTAATLETKEG